MLLPNPLLHSIYNSAQPPFQEVLSLGTTRPLSILQVTNLPQNTNYKLKVLVIYMMFNSSLLCNSPKRSYKKLTIELKFKINARNLFIKVAGCHF